MVKEKKGVVETMKRILLLLLIIFLPTAYALQIEKYHITAQPLDYEKTKNTVEVTIYNDEETVTSIVIINLALDTKIQTIFDAYGEVEYTIQQQKYTQIVTLYFTKALTPGEHRTITITTESYNLIKKEEYIEYVLVTTPLVDIVEFTHSVFIPKELLGEGDIEKQIYGVVPYATVTEATNGVWIEWNTPLEGGNPTSFIVRFTYKEERNMFAMIVYAVVLLIFFATCIFLSVKVWKLYKQRRALDAIKILSIREKAVLECVIKNPGIKQHEVVRMLKYTKSSTSKIVKRLQFRELLDVTKDGNIRILTPGKKLGK